MDVNLKPEIEGRKKKAIRNRDQLHWIILGSIIAGAVTAVGHLYFDDSTRQGEVVGTSVTVAGLIGTLLAILLHRHEVKCPRCGYDWEIDERNETHRLTWTYCPGCGLQMQEDVLRFGVRDEDCGREG